MGDGVAQTPVPLNFGSVKTDLLMKLSDELRENGCVLLRGALPFGRVVEYKNALEDIYRKTNGNGDVPGHEFLKHSGLRMRDLFSTTAIDETARNFLGRCSPFNSTFMSVSVNAENSIRGLGLHTDGIIQGTTDTVLCMWAPLHHCGVNAPGLALVKAGKNAVIRYLRRHFRDKEIPGWHSDKEWSSTEAFTEEAVTAEFGEIWKPALGPGDVVLFTNWTIHGSHITPQMTDRRSAAIYRMSNKSFVQRLMEHEFRVFGLRYNLAAWLRSHQS